MIASQARQESDEKASGQKSVHDLTARLRNEVAALKWALRRIAEDSTCLHEAQVCALVALGQEVDRE